MVKLGKGKPPMASSLRLMLPGDNDCRAPEPRHPNDLARSDEVVVAAAAAKEYGIEDTGGRQPTPLTIEDA